MSINTFTVSGNLTRNAEPTANGGGVNFSIANNERTKNADGEWADSTNFFDCVLWGEKRVEALAPRLTKGTKVVVSGRVRERHYTGRDGVAKRGYSVIVSEVEILTNRDANAAQAAPQSRTDASASVYDDEIPF